MLQLCTSCPLADLYADHADELVFTRKRVRCGESLYRAGDAFGALYALRSGFLKSSVVLEDGKQQITGFPMAGEMLGMDGIGTGRYTLDLVALENSDVYVIPFACLETEARKAPLLQRQLHRIMSREMERCQAVMLLLGTMRAEVRVVMFLLNLSMRFAARGYSPVEFNLRMSRDDIGSYLGLTL
ncbi:MAG TPA: cyclic nucleotide-binding domain-containing protein, partial [Burkholderiales bacterium]|nr:cyclic nucleotide-binding domain-containing protein [Burkholderiales bacterium]